MTDQGRKQSPDALVSLARRAIEAYVTTGEMIGRREIPGLEPRRAGVFVSLHLDDGSLRGCIGTLEPTQPTIEDEIVANAISAATRDPRFLPLTADELQRLDVSVDVLGDPEEIPDASYLDPREYGLIVQTDDGRRALLLPDLEGVDTPERQLLLTCRKGGIDPDRDRCRLFRFQVERHH